MTEFHQEKDEVPGRTIIAVLAIVLVVTAAGVFIAWAIEDCRTTELRGTAEPAERELILPAEVNAMELTLFDEEGQGIADKEVARRRLTTYGWADRDQGTVHIPIDQAFQLYLERRREAAP